MHQTEGNQITKPMMDSSSGVVTFLEEDHYLTPDSLWVLNLMETLMTRNLCKGCNLLSLGTYLKTWNIRTAHDSVRGFHYSLFLAFSRITRSLTPDGDDSDLFLIHFFLKFLNRVKGCCCIEMSKLKNYFSHSKYFKMFNSQNAIIYNPPAYY